MSKKIVVKAGKAELVLEKSEKLVGIKSKQPEELREKGVERQVLRHLGGFKVVEVAANNAAEADTRLDELRQQREVEVGTHVYHTEGNRRPIVPTGEIYITFEPSMSQEEIDIVLDEFKLECVEVRDGNICIARTTKDSKNPLKVAHALQATSMVRRAEPDLDTLLDEYFDKPQDDLFSHMWHLDNSGRVVDANWPLKAGADAKVVDAWQRLGDYGSSSVRLAVIDNGFDMSHPDYKDKVVAPFDLWSNSDKIIQNDPSFTHGTPCASIAIAAANGNGIVGAAPNAQFMPVSGTSFSLRATEQMFNYCIDHSADVISCSWGTTDARFALSPLKERAIARAASKGRGGKGAVICFAVGNEDLDYVNFYAAHPDVIAVAACTSKDQHASYSNRGPEVTVCAPSNGDWPVIAARAAWDEGVPWETGDYRYWRDGKPRGEANKYKHFGGTSSACPLVAGVCALILSANPDLTARQVKEVLTSTADKIGSPDEYDERGHSHKYGYGRVNADRAVAEAIRRREGKAPVKEVEDKVQTGRGIFRFSVARQPARGFGVQVGVYAEYGNVLIAVEQLQQRYDLPVVVSINELRSRTVYKIVLGAFDDISDARSLRNRVDNDGIDEAFVRKIADLE